MRKPFLLSLLVALLTTLSTHAYDFQSGDLYYNITSSNTVEVTYQNSWSESNYQGLTTATIPETVTYNGNTYSVTSIRDYAFAWCSSLTSITLPSSVTSIGIHAFYGCSSLTSITIPESVTSIGGYAFYGCSSLTSITLHNSVTSIGNYAFYDCSSLTSLTIPNSVTSIGNYAFHDCSSLTSITIPESVTSIGGYAFYGCSSLTSITIPNSVTSIGSSAFSSCSSLTSVSLGNSVTSIGSNAFYKCSSLTSITLPNSVTSIGAWAFAGCSSLTSVSLPNSVTSIGRSAFAWCSSLTSITIPNSVTSIGDRAFWDCSSLTSIVVESGNTMYDSRENCNAIIETASNTLIAGCQSTIIPNSVTSIENNAFENCSSLTSITIPNSVTSIGSGAFGYCTSITSITIPNSVTSIGDEAFSGCSSLTSIVVESGNTMYDSRENCNAIIETATNTLIAGCQSTIIPNSVTSIGDDAFLYCSSLTSITIPNSVTSIGSHAFYKCSSLTSITIPNSVTSIGDEAFNDVLNIMYSGTATGSPWGARSVNGYVEGYLVYADDTKTTLLACSAAATGEITIPNSVTGIGYEAFSGCSSLTSITLPNSVTSIGEYAFLGCSSLTSVTSLSCTPPSCGSNVFYYTPSEKTLVVPSISMDAYKNSSTWEEFTSFEKCLSVFVQSSDSTLGVAQIDQEVDCDSVAIISAVGNLGYAFTQWSDGNTDNPRTIKLTHDTTLTAEFGLAKCGDDLYWAYSNQEIKITGSGAMYNYTDSTMPWMLLRDSIKTVRIGNNATSIGEYAFSNTPKLAELHIGTNVENIGANAFSGCRRLYDIYCYPTNPPFAETNSFANYNVYVHVPCASLEAYDMDVVFGSFKYVECIGSEDAVITDKTVTVVPGDADATFTWPVTDNAETYSLVITKDGVTFCTLVFNAQGQLVSIAFKPRRQNAPAAEGTTPATYAEMTANGFRFTVTGLNEGSAYAYTLTVRNAANTVLETYTGDFTTLSNTPTGINESAGEDAHGQVEKILRDGQVLILRNGETYNMMGQTL